MTITVEEVRDYLAPFPDNDARRRAIEAEADDVRAVYRNDPLHSRLKIVFAVHGGAFVFTHSRVAEAMKPWPLCLRWIMISPK